MTSSLTSSRPSPSPVRTGSAGRVVRRALSKIGPLAVISSLALSWPAFAGATGEGGDGTVAFGLWVGAASILLMSWSFLLALRPRILEPLFGGLDSMYKVHRWAGAVSVAFMFLHTSIEPEIEGGIRGAARSLADTAEELAGVGEIMIYLLIALSVVRLFPYRWWRLTHKLLGVPFAFACFHFFTAEKPYANSSSWGWWFGTWMVVGLVAFVARVIGRDMVDKGHKYRVTEATHDADISKLTLEPVGRPMRQHAGQFAFVKLDAPGMSEPHPFTIASSPDNPSLEFYIKHLGDWSARLPQTDLIGCTAHVEGPYGMFEPTGRDDQPVLWVAGGVGVTPFLAAIDQLGQADTSDSTSPTSPPRTVPVLLYATRSTEVERLTNPDPIIDELERADAEGRISLHLFTPDTGRLSPGDLDRLFPGGLAGYHVALCGPTGLVKSMGRAATERGAATIETEDFDIRGGFGPDRVADLPDRITDQASPERLERAQHWARRLTRSNG